MEWFVCNKEALDAFGYGTNSQDPRFELTYYAGKVEGPNGTIKLDDGTDLEYVPSEITLDLSGKASEKTAGARMKNMNWMLLLPMMVNFKVMILSCSDMLMYF